MFLTVEFLWQNKNFPSEGKELQGKVIKENSILQA